jgi:SAM-dependent methyltransferase
MGGVREEYWVNLDYNTNVRAEVYADISKRLPFTDNTFDYVYCSHVLEHFEKKEVFRIMEELHRICKPGAKIEIYVPHYTSTIAFKVPYHYSYYGIGTFENFSERESDMGERYSTVRFKVIKEELHLGLRHYRNYPGAQSINIFNMFFNFGRSWQTMMERLWGIGFDEIKYELEVIK